LFLRLARALAAIDLLDNEIMIYATIEEEFGLEVPGRMDAASTALASLRDFFEEQLQLRLTHKGGPRPDSRRQLCALVCASAWRRLYGEMQPYRSDSHIRAKFASLHSMARTFVRGREPLNVNG
jgi:hypothetical protein